ncbi:MAG: ABC transporter ATP-binding protein [Parachlamydiaceae bacterium]
MTTEAAIRCAGIKKHYGRGENLVDALKGINIEIFKGELTLLVGPSGSGKTTLLSIITAILTPDKGEIFLLNENIWALSPTERAKFCRENLGIVFQSLYLIPTLTVLENITLPLIIAGVKGKLGKEKAMDLLDRMHLAHRAHFPPTSLSKGQQQRVAIARAMINDSQILICDEPTSALDQTSGFEIMTLLKEKVLNSSRAILVVTHDQRTFPFADRIIHMNDGQIIQGAQHE